MVRGFPFCLVVFLVWFSGFISAWGQAKELKVPIAILEQELEVDSGSDWTLTATLASRRDRASNTPLVILVHDFGARTRNNNINSFIKDQSALFQMISDSLSSQGVRVLRYDKRGVVYDPIGDDAEVDWDVVEVSGVQEYAADLKSLVAYARRSWAREGVPIYLLGVGGGSDIAALVAAEIPIDGLISLSTKVASYDEQLSFYFIDNQLDCWFEQDSNKDQKLDPLELKDWPLFEQFDSDDDAFLTRQELTPYFEQELAVIYSTPEVKTVRGSYERVPSTTELFQKLKVPVLLLHGQRDRFRDFGLIPAFVDKLRHQAVRVDIFSYPFLGVNLGFQAETAENQYGVIKNFVLSDMIEWIHQQSI